MRDHQLDSLQEIGNNINTEKWRNNQQIPSFRAFKNVKCYLPIDILVQEHWKNHYANRCSEVETL